MRKQLIFTSIILLLMLGATALVVIYGKGYRLNLQTGTPSLSGTGLLVATSTPDGAQVFINGHLTTATDNTINLVPGDYDVKIFKEGYLPWEKKLIVKKEVVTKADALLLPTAPKLESITNIGVSNPVIDPSQSKIAYLVASQSARKNGIYVLDMSVRPILTLQSASSQIVDETLNTFSQTQISWSPDGSEILATISGEISNTIYLLKTNGFNQAPLDVSETLTTVNDSWNKQQAEKEKARNDSLKKNLKNLISANFRVLAWSPDETKILYEASLSGSLPLIINPRLIGTNSTPEQRQIEKSKIYVYDIKEDRNYKVLDSIPANKNLNSHWLPIMWYPDSKHLIHVNGQKIDIMEYDNTNITTVYGGPFVDNYVFPWSDGSRIVILTNLGNPNITPNLYTISLK